MPRLGIGIKLRSYCTATTSRFLTTKGNFHAHGLDGTDSRGIVILDLCIAAVVKILESFFFPGKRVFYLFVDSYGVSLPDAKLIKITPLLIPIDDGSWKTLYFARKK